MSGQLIPPPELAPSVPKDATPQQCIAIWCDLMDACHQFLLAGLRREIGPDGDLEAAYRQRYAEQTEEHHRVMQRMVDRFNQTLGGDDAE